MQSSVLYCEKANNYLNIREKKLDIYFRIALIVSQRSLGTEFANMFFSSLPQSKGVFVQSAHDLVECGCGLPYLINDASFGEKPQSFPGGSDSTFWVTWLSLYATSSFKSSNVTLADVFVEYFNVFLTKLYRWYYYDHLDISGCQWLSIGKSSTFDETGLWDAIVHATEIRATELCYVLHGYPWLLLPNYF